MSNSNDGKRYVVKWMSPEGSEYNECDTLQEARSCVERLKDNFLPRGMVAGIRGIFILDDDGCQTEVA